MKRKRLSQVAFRDGRQSRGNRFVDDLGGKSRVPTILFPDHNIVADRFDDGDVLHAGMRNGNHGLKWTEVGVETADASLCDSVYSSRRTDFPVVDFLA